jgi:uncharacterized protein (DUF1330 family)
MSGWVDPTRAAFDLFKALPRDEPIWMLNLVRYKAIADYPADHMLHGEGLTGAQAYGRYGAESGPIFQRVGGKIVWRGAMQLMLTGPDDEFWDAVFIAHYSSAHAFMAMVTDAGYREAVKHRQAAVADSRLIRCQALSTDGGFG